MLADALHDGSTPPHHHRRSRPRRYPRRGLPAVRLDLAASHGWTRGAVQAADSSARAAGVALDSNIAGPRWIDGDRLRIDQIVSNLLGNAIKYTPRGGRVRADIESDASTVRISIADHGVGIRADRLDDVFEMFAQVDPTIDRRAGGLGIGLTVSRMLARLHGGDVTAASDGHRRGSVFRLAVPAAPAPVLADRAAAEAGAPQGRSIVVVEDNDDLRDMFQAVLDAAGHDDGSRAAGG